MFVCVCVCVCVSAVYWRRQLNLSGMNLNFVIDLFVCIRTCSCTVRVMQLCICVCFVADVPRVRLELGRNLEGDHIREGIDVYFDCHVVARPNAVRLVWRHQVSWTKQQQLLFFFHLDPLVAVGTALVHQINSFVMFSFVPPTPLSSLLSLLCAKVSFASERDDHQQLITNSKRAAEINYKSKASYKILCGL